MANFNVANVKNQNLRRSKNVELVCLNKKDLAKVYAKVILTNFLLHNQNAEKSRLIYTDVNNIVEHNYNVKPATLSKEKAMDENCLSVGTVFYCIQDICYSNNLPLITCLVVKSGKGISGDGFFSAMLSKDDGQNIYVNFLQENGISYVIGDEITDDMKAKLWNYECKRCEDCREWQRLLDILNDVQPYINN